MLKKINGKTYAIPDAEIDSLVDNLECSIAEAIDLWLTDNGVLDNAEQNKADAAAKENVKTSTLVKAKSYKPKTQRERVLKPDEIKEQIIAAVAKSLQDLGATVKVTDPRKLIEFAFGADDFKLNLTRTRKPKAD